MIAIAINVFLVWLPTDNSPHAVMPQDNRLDAFPRRRCLLKGICLQLDRTHKWRRKKLRIVFLLEGEYFLRH
jgi:hypothetical protein